MDLKEQGIFLGLSFPSAIKSTLLEMSSGRKMIMLDTYFLQTWKDICPFHP